MKPTVDPDTKDQQQNTEREAGISNAAEGAPVVEFAYHADLRRIGERTRADALSPWGVPIVVGRAGPLFERPDATGGDPWEDPCISRGQLSVAWDARNRVFHVGPIEGARRGLDPISGPLPVGARTVVRVEEDGTEYFFPCRVCWSRKEHSTGMGLAFDGVPTRATLFGDEDSSGIRWQAMGLRSMKLGVTAQGNEPKVA